ncbi:hypothetical protein [Burkholderia phage BCSR52]|uniref:Uncharacterized protein n=1 Tax=Burkholderia phage BCSR52 TaxID=2805748 RepID=A0A889IQR3_9CAUD|nr:hypothetical protein [Burkholderia phage BCSR52]
MKTKNKITVEHIEGYDCRVLLTAEEAEAFIKRAPAGTEFCLSVRLDAAIADKPGHVYPDAIATYLSLSRAQALHIAASGLRDSMEEKNARFTMYSASRFDYRRDRKSWTLWIGQ